MQAIVPTGRDTNAGTVTNNGSTISANAPDNGNSC
jgi:hypothetical protein